MTAHPWHEVDPGFLQKESIVHGVIEISHGSKAKYEVDKTSGLLRLDRVIFAAFHYPINYGFIPRTLGQDGDPLDILILSQVPIEPLCLVKTRVIGVMEMVDRGENDEKIVAVAEGDASVSHLSEIEDLPVNYREELKHFFNHYKNLEQKKVTADRFLSRAIALERIAMSLKHYSEKFPHTLPRASL
ncbi:MAG: inorganic diphosphatase [Flavobacteriales bacterium]|nr:inorganic diphosphatase [Flavobacteriales bacterium]